MFSFWRSSKGEEYQSLHPGSPSSSETLTLLDEHEGKTGIPPSRPHHPRLIALASVLTVLCTLFNLVNLLLPFITPSPPTPASLPRPNQFIGLESINYTSHAFPKDTKITTFPWVLARIDRTRPDTVVEGNVDPRRKFTYFGTVSPEDRQLVATNEISTVAQFRTRDWAMEWCRFKLSLPDSARYIPGSEGPDGIRERNWFLEGDTSDLEVWELDVAPNTWLDPRKLTYRTRPKRKGHIFSFRVSANRTVVSREFPCKADGIGSFELFCASPRCRIDVWQDKQVPPVGLSLEQRSSV
ncbi:hypothetical protein JB92DRAFT_2973110 [Gautieria morchelliformis]|nr:hypothetical protein JB92DRAFT_2973110 [Gautieria morchelliformis]